MLSRLNPYFASAAYAFEAEIYLYFAPVAYAFGAEIYLFCPCRFAFGAEIKKSDLVALFYFATAFLAASANCVNAAASVTAKSANILRLTSIPATFKPCIKRL